MPIGGKDMPKFKSAATSAQMPSDGVVEGYAATFDRERDVYGDVILKGAFTRTLVEWREKGSDGIYIPLLFDHNTSDPEYNIGRVVDAYEDETGLFVRAEFDADNHKAQYVRKLAQEGRLYQFSFAYGIKDAAEIQLDGSYAFELRDLDLFEVSLVQIPANQHAIVTGIKSGRRNSKADADELRSIGELAEQIQAISELAEQIKSSIAGLLADEDEPGEPDGGPDGEDNAEEPDGVNAEDPSGKDAEDTERLEAAKAYAQVIINALEV